MEIRFKWTLFARLFTTTAVITSLLFAIMYLLAVPFIQNTVNRIEENAGRTILKNVYEMVEQMNLELENYRNSVILERKSQLRNIVDIVEARATMLEKEVQSGEITKEQNLEKLLNELRHITYGHDDYVWASNYGSILISHPDPKLNNADFSQQRDLRGKLIVPPMVAGALSKKEGYYSYWWHRLADQQPIEKLSYYKLIPFFNLVIGTGIYLDDVEATVHLKQKAAIDNLRQRLRTTHLAKSGYVYIFDGNKNMVIHPNTNIEGTDFSMLRNPSTNTPIAPILMNLADKQEGLHYLWDRPNDPDNYSYEKISWVRYFEPFDWYICTSVYVAELDESAMILRRRVVMVFTATMLFSVLLTYLFTKRLTDPLRHLSDTALRVVNGEFDARCHINRDDEIGVVATAFNGMVDHLQDNIRHLDSKVAERTNELQVLNDKLQALTVTDSLTGIANRYCFDEALKNEWIRAARLGQSLSLGMLDIDWFKNYNDYYGHQEGDECLRQVAKLFSATICRTGDLVARYGGEEFVFIAPVTSAESAQQIAKNVCTQLQQQAIVHERSPLQYVTVSIGVSTTIPDTNRSPEVLVQAADAALYRAKEQGRNQVIFTESI